MCLSKNWQAHKPGHLLGFPLVIPLKITGTSARRGLFPVPFPLQMFFCILHVKSSTLNPLCLLGGTGRAGTCLVVPKGTAIEWPLRQQDVLIGNKRDSRADSSTGSAHTLPVLVPEAMMVFGEPPRARQGPARQKWETKCDSLLNLTLITMFRCEHRLHVFPDLCRVSGTSDSPSVRGSC